VSVLVVRLRGSEPHDVLAVAGDGTGELARALNRLDRDVYRYLPYIDPFGLTIFNGVQMAVVLPELSRLRRELRSASLSTKVDEITKLAERCRDEVHLYLEFEGD
jgi:hypothetical protein